jgi:UDPglucose 6-dehydrogenase
MRLCVYGLWHLGCVTAACCAEAGLETVAIDPDADVVARLRQGQAPLFEPGLDDLIQSGSKSGRLQFASDARAGVSRADVVWVTFDTPVDDEDRADADKVLNAVRSIFPHLREGAIVLISSQLPVGSTRRLAAEFRERGGRNVCFCYSPENLRLGSAIRIFTQPGRIVIGVDDAAARDTLKPLLERFCDNLIWTSVPAAEMTKHGINAFLATCVTFMNEIAQLCERVGADAGEVERALRSEPRIGPSAYIRPGAAFAGGTLARDVQFLQGLAQSEQMAIPLLSSVIASNEAHKRWPLRQLTRIFGPKWQGLTVALLGLTYKPGTDTLRRSQAVEVGKAIAAEGATVRAFDPALREAPRDLPKAIQLMRDMHAAITGADAVILATEWPQFKALSADDLASAMARPRLIDANGLLGKSCGSDPRIAYYKVGSVA